MKGRFKREAVLGLQRVSPKEKEEILAAFDTTGKVQTVARKFNRSPSGVKYTIQNRFNDGLEEARRKQRERFVKEAWDVVMQGLEKLREKLDSASVREIASAIGMLLDKINTMSGTELKLTLMEQQQKVLEISRLSDEELDRLLNQTSSESKQPYE